MQIPYDPFVAMPIDAFDHELNFGASAGKMIITFFFLFYFTEF